MKKLIKKHVTRIEPVASPVDGYTKVRFTNEDNETLGVLFTNDEQTLMDFCDEDDNKHNAASDRLITLFNTSKPLADQYPDPGYTILDRDETRLHDINK